MRHLRKPTRCGTELERTGVKLRIPAHGALRNYALPFFFRFCLRCFYVWCYYYDSLKSAHGSDSNHTWGGAVVAATKLFRGAGFFSGDSVTAPSDLACKCDPIAAAMKSPRRRLPRLHPLPRNKHAAAQTARYPSRPDVRRRRRGRGNWKFHQRETLQRPIWV